MPSTNDPSSSSNRKRKESFAMPPCFIIFYNITSDLSKIYYQSAVCSHLLTLVSRSLIFLPWRWIRYVPPKRRFTQNLHGATSQKTAFFKRFRNFMCLHHHLRCLMMEIEEISKRLVLNTDWLISLEDFSKFIRSEIFKAYIRITWKCLPEEHLWNYE
jgi:hypothetical protein